MNRLSNELSTPKTGPKSEPGCVFPRVVSRNSQFKNFSDSLSVTHGIRPSFVIAEKQKDIIKNNQILLTKMLDIERSPSWFVVKEEQIFKPKYSESNKKKIKQIKYENSFLQTKLKGVKSTYNLIKFEEDYKERSKKLNKSCIPDPVFRNHTKTMKTLEKMISEELHRKASYKKLFVSN